MFAPSISADAFDFSPESITILTLALMLMLTFGVNDEIETSIFFTSVNVTVNFVCMYPWSANKGK